MLAARYEAFCTSATGGSSDCTVKTKNQHFGTVRCFSAVCFVQERWLLVPSLELAA